MRDKLPRLLDLDIENSEKKKEKKERIKFLGQWISDVGHHAVNSCIRRPLFHVDADIQRSVGTSISPRPSVQCYWLKSHTSMIKPARQHTGSHTDLCTIYTEHNLSLYTHPRAKRSSRINIIENFNLSVKKWRPREVSSNENS